MATQTTNMEVVVSADTTQLDKAIDASAARTAKKIQDSTKASAIQLAKQNSLDSGTARGLGGLTGASARDFASQSQGLGGVVRLYATFAANLFAASAAFGALSRAADTTNMVKGLDQLGAASGRALGSLSKQLVAATNGAISLRDAMSATALASAGGMSNQAILRLGNAAKQASLALGVAMPDAISRLSRGIVKLEPELLDEIGIMVRVDKVVADYAKSVGKSALAVTDFEKRQAFANAVLDQAEKKFGAIKIDANPYAKILASMENLAQKGLELVNFVLTPMLSILSSSPTALATAMAAVVGILLKQAMPALGSIKQALRERADEATNLALQKAAEAQKGVALEYSIEKKAAQEKFKLRREAAIAQATATAAIAKKAADDAADAAVAAVDKAEEQMKARQGSFSKKSAAAQIAGKSIDEITDKQIAALYSSAKTQNTNGRPQAAQDYLELANTIEKAKIAEAKAEAARVNQSTISADVEKKLATEINAIKTKYAADEDTFAKQQIKNQSSLNTIKQTQIIANRELLNSISRNITAQAAETASVRGISAAWREARASVSAARVGGQERSITDALGNVTQVTTPAMGKVQGVFTLVRAGASGLTAAIGTLVSAFSVWAAGIGIAVVLVQGLYNWMSKSREEAEKYSAALEGMTSSAKTVRDTIAQISSKDGKELLSAESILARANAFLGLSDAINIAVANYEKLDRLKNGAEIIVDKIYSLFGRGDLQLLTKGVTDNLEQSLKLIQDPKLLKQYSDAIKQLVGKQDVELTQSGLTSALNKLDDTRKLAVLRELGNLDKKIATNLNNASGALTSFSNSVDALDSSLKNLFNGLVSGDTLTKVGIEGLTLVQNLKKAVKEGDNGLAATDKLLGSGITGLFSDETITQLKIGKKSLEELSQTAKTAQVSLANFKDEGERSDIKKTMQQQQQANSLAVAQMKASSITNPDGTINTKAREQSIKKVMGVVNQEQLGLQNSVKLAQDNLSEANKRQGSILANALKSTEAQFEDYIKRAERTANALAQIGRERAQLGVDASYGANTFAKEAELVKRESGIKISEIREQEKLALATSNSANRMEELSDVVRENTLQLKLSQGGLSPRELEAISNEQLQLKQRRDDRRTQQESNPNQKAIQSGANAKIAAELGNRDASLIQITDRSSKFINQQYRSILDDALQQNSLAKERLNLQVQYGVALNEEAELESYNASKAEEYLKYLKEQSILEEQLKGLSKDKQSTEYKLVEGKLQQLRTDTESKRIADETAYKYKIAIAKLEEANKKREHSLDLQKASFEIANLQAGALISELEYLKDIGAISEGDYLVKKANLDLTKERTSAELSLLDIENKRVAAVSAIQEKQKAAGVNGDTAAYDKAIDKENELAAVRSLSVETSVRLNSLNIANTTANSVLQAKFNDELKLAEATTQSLTTLFGEMGSNIGLAVENLTKLAQTDEKYAKDRRRVETEILEAQMLGEAGRQLEADAKQELANLDKKYTRDQINNMASVAGTSKKIFKEETLAYKVLDGLEKASNILKLGLAAQELAVKLGLFTTEASAAVATEGTKTAASVAGSAARTAATIPEIYAKFMAQLGPVGIAVASAAIAAFLGGGRGRGGSIGPSVEDMQKASGTGQSYDSNGNLQNNGGGALGDSQAKSEAIQKGIERLAEINYEMLDFGKNRTYDALIAIKDNTEGFVKAVSGKLAASGTNSLFGTQEGTTAPGGVASFINNLGLGTIFGETVDRKIQDAGINISGSLADVIAGKGTQEAFEKVRDEWSSFLDSGVNEFTKTQTLDPQLGKYINGVFDNFKTLLLTAADELGTSADVASNILDSANIKLSVSSKGLTGAEYANAIMAAIGIQLDLAAQTAFPSLAGLSQKFQEFGETSTDFIIRIIDTSKNVSLAFDSIGKSIDYLSGVSKTEIALELTKAAGSLSDFISLTGKFSDNFLTEKDKIEPVFRAVVQGLSDLGISSITTRTQFKELVSGFKVTDQASAEMYVSLLKLAPAFDSVIGYVEQLTGLTSNSLSDVLKQGLLGSLDSAELGKQLAKQIEEGIYNALADSFANQISSIFVDQVINPMVTAVLTGGALTEAVSTSTMENIVDVAKRSVEALSTLFQDPGFIAAMKSIRDTVSSISLIGSQVVNKPFTYESSKSATDTKDPIKEEQEKLQAQLDKLRLDAMSKLKQREVERSKLLSEVARQTYDLIKIEEDLAEARKQLADATKRISTTLDSVENTARNRQLDRTRELSEAIDDNVRASLNYLYALEDVAIATSAAKAAQLDFTSKLETLVSSAKGIISARDTALQDNYTEALEKKKDAEKALNDYIKDSVKGLRDLTKDLAKFLKLLDTTDLGGSSKADQLLAARAEFEDTLAKTRLGDKAAAESLPELATKLLELSKETSATAVDYQRDVAKVRSSISSVIDLGNTTADQLARNAGLTTEAVDEFQVLTKNVADAIKDATYWEDKAKEIGLTLDKGDQSAKEKYTKLENEAARVITEMLKFADSLDPASKAQLESLWNSKTGLDAFWVALNNANQSFANIGATSIALAEALAKAQSLAGSAGSIAYGGGTIRGTNIKTEAGTITKTAAQELIEKLTKEGMSSKDILLSAVDNYGARASDIISAGKSAGISGFEELIYAKGGTASPGGKVYTYEELKNAAEAAKAQGMTSEQVLDAAVQMYGLDRRTVKDITGLATGTNYVPQDMLAQIHEGEAVVPKKYNPAANGNNELIMELINQVRIMSNEIKELRKEQLNGDLANVQATKTVTRILRDVTKDGTAITTTTE